MKGKDHHEKLYQHPEVRTVRYQAPVPAISAAATRGARREVSAIAESGLRANNLQNGFERALGMGLGLKALRACDELWIISPRISSGMSAEIKKAQKCGIPVLVFTAEGFRVYTGNGDMTDNCHVDTADGVID